MHKKLFSLAAATVMLLGLSSSAAEQKKLTLEQPAPVPAVEETTTENAWYKPIWTSTNLQYLFGSDNYETGDENQKILSLEHASGYKWGDLFFFVDYIDQDKSGLGDDLYFEIHPRLSLSYLTGKDLSYGIIKDVFIATEYNRDGNANPNDWNNGDFEALLYGFGVALDVEGFSYLNVNLYCRDDQEQDGETTQLSVDWCYPFTIGPADLYCSGFFDWAGEEGNASQNFLFETRVMMDTGKFFGFEKSLYTGIEYKYWQNKYGVDALDEKTLNFSLIYTF